MNKLPPFRQVGGVQSQDHESILIWVYIIILPLSLNFSIVFLTTNRIDIAFIEHCERGIQERSIKTRDARPFFCEDVVAMVSFFPTISGKIKPEQSVAHLTRGKISVRCRDFRLFYQFTIIFVQFEARSFHFIVEDLSFST